MLTERQYLLLMYIRQRQQHDGITPSFEEMRIAVGLKSKSGIHQLITALEQRGYLKRLFNRARALEIIKLPENVVGYTPKPQPDNRYNMAEVTELPFLGRIEAGVAIEAIEYQAETLTVPNILIGHGEHFVLEVSGDSMIDAGIHDGDYVLIRKQHTAQSGQIVVACIDGDDVTLKRIQTKGSAVALKPENAAYQTQIYGASRIEIKGVLAGLMRSY
ncbi:MAG: transcriptional repressor LexA [Alphaproteobacteria bacterium]|nr:transcriptional repressor LexA [Alphaproteobacteria bacterium]